MNIIPLRNQILCEEVRFEGTTWSQSRKILIPETSKAGSVKYCKILAKGDGYVLPVDITGIDVTEHQVNMDSLQEGDVVIINEHSGHQFSIGAQRYIMVSYEECLGILVDYEKRDEGVVDNG